ncbi:MAG: glycosyltransferase family 87 protein [Anaerolineales bacterium]
MKRINYRRVFVIAGLATLLLVYILLWLRMISSPAERTGTDFISPYSAARVAQRWGGAHVYDLGLQQTIQAEVVGFSLVPGQVLAFDHPPYLLPLLAILVNGNYLTSLLRYAALMVAFYLASAGIIAWLLRRAAWKQTAVLLLLAGILTFYPVFVSLDNTQDTAIMVFGGFLWMAGLLTGQDWLAGLGLALTSVRPHVTVLLAVPFLFRRQKVFGWFCLAGAVLGVVSLACVGVDGIRGYLNVLLVATGGNWYGMKEPLMVNLIGLLWRAAPGLGDTVIHWIGWTVYGLALAGLCVLWARSREITEKQIGLAVTVTVFAVPHLHYHDLALLVVALVAVLLVLVRGKFLHAQNAALIPLVLSVALLFSNFLDILKYNFPYLVMLLLVIALLLPGLLFRSKEHST